MPNYSVGERTAMIAAFSKLFEISKEVASQAPIMEWMSEAPEAIVEYGDYLRGEQLYDRNQRMEIASVYDGVVTDLVSYLRHLYPDRKGTPKWVLIFQVYNDILDVRPMIERAESSLVVSSEVETESDASTEIEATQETPSVSADALLENPGTNEVTSDEELPRDALIAEEHEESPVTPTTNTDDMPSGNAKSEDGNHLYNNNINIETMEEKEMSNVNDLFENATGASITGDPSAPAAPANVEASKSDLKEAQEQAIEFLKQNSAGRTGYTQSTMVNAIITVQKPAMERIVGAASGKLLSAKQLKEAGKSIEEKQLAFIAKVTGKQNVTIAEFEAMSDDDKYSNVCPGKVKVGESDVSYKAIAVEMWNLLKKAAQDPEMEWDAQLPAKKSITAKGYQLGGDVLTTDEFIVRLLEKSNGAVYGAGSLTNDGAEKEGATTFVVAVAKKAKKAASTQITVQAQTTKVPVVRVKNKDAFIADDTHIKYLFNEPDTDSSATAAFRAKLSVNGLAVAASIPTWERDDNGNMVKSGVNRKQEDVFKKKMCSLSVYVPVTKMTKNFSDEAKAGESVITLVANRWGVSSGVKVAGADYSKIDTLDAMPVFNVFAQILSGDVDLAGHDAIQKSGVVNALNAQKDASAAEAAADAKDALED